MPKKVKRSIKPNLLKIKTEKRKQNDFFFLVIVSVFAALTLITANYLAHQTQLARSLQKVNIFGVAELDIVP